MIDRLRGLDRTTLLTVLGLLGLAALLRLPNLATRGTWDSDQGHDMLVLRAFVRDGIVPLLGPPTSIGDVHHGAWYYYVLAPAAFLTGGDSPLAVVLVIALSGIAAVGVTWWLARAIGGPLAGLVAGGLMAISAAAIDESTFIWNPNLIALSSSVALAGAWRAWSTGESRWWFVATLGTALTMQCHILGAALLPVVGALLVADVRRGGGWGPGRPDGRRPGPGAGTVLACLGILGLSYLPLVVSELTTGFGEVRAALDYIADGRSGDGVALPARIGIAGLRVVSWPLIGLITSGFLPAVAATSVVVGIIAWRWRGPTPERMAVRWLGLALLWSTLFLAVAAPSLATVVVGLPNDHYHAFADPMVFTLVGLGSAALARSVPGRVLAGTGLVALAGWNLTHAPPAVHPDGGFPAAVIAARRVEDVVGAAGMERGAVVPIRSLPDFKSTESMAYPLVRLGRPVSAETPDGLSPGSVPPPVEPRVTVVLCDSLFEASIGGACGGPAEALEEARARSGAELDAGLGPLLDRFQAAPGRWVSVYGPP